MNEWMIGRRGRTSHRTWSVSVKANARGNRWIEKDLEASENEQILQRQPDANRRLVCHLPVARHLIILWDHKGREECKQRSNRKSLTSHHLPDLLVICSTRSLPCQATMVLDALHALHAVALEILPSTLLIGCIMA